MTISGIGSSSYSVGMLSGMRTRSASGGTEQAPTKEKPNLGELFTKLDADGSGGLDSTEVQSLTEKISEATGVSVDLSEFLATYDADSDGTLSEDETVSALEANRPQGPPPPPPGGMGGMRGPDESEMVSSADTNGDGVISAEEAEALVGIVNNATGSSLEAEDFVGSYDSDGDGSLSTDEAVAAMEANRPQGPSARSEGQVSGAEGLDSILAAAIEQYMNMAAMGREAQAGGGLLATLTTGSGSIGNVA